MSVSGAESRNHGYSPTLFDPTSTGYVLCSALLDAVCHMDDRRTAIDVIRETAEDVGADFMFEIPGLLLEEGDVDACVIKRPNDDETEPDGWKHVFVVFNRQHATIQLLDFFDVPEKAQAFFCSYTSVLTRLSKISATHRSH